MMEMMVKRMRIFVLGRRARCIQDRSFPAGGGFFVSIMVMTIEIQTPNPKPHNMKACRLSQ